MLEDSDLAAMANRVWSEPLDWPTFDGDGEVASKDAVREAVEEGAAWDGPQRAGEATP